MCIVPSSLPVGDPVVARLDGWFIPIAEYSRYAVEFPITYTPPYVYCVKISASQFALTLRAVSHLACMRHRPGEHKPSIEAVQR